MFNSIRGVISGHDYPMLFVTGGGGVEWAIEVSAQTFQGALGAQATEKSTPSEGDLRRFYVHMYVREDILKLYGFSDLTERTAFRQLLSVSGIGPKQALKILSGTTVRELTAQLDNEDLTALTRIPGLGKKTAQKIILQLKGTLVPSDDQSGSSPTRAGGGMRGEEDELVLALVEMGFDRTKAQEALAVVRRRLNETESADDEQELFRRAIVHLSAAPIAHQGR